MIDCLTDWLTEIFVWFNNWIFEGCPGCVLLSEWIFGRSPKWRKRGRAWDGCWGDCLWSDELGEDGDQLGVDCGQLASPPPHQLTRVPQNKDNGIWWWRWQFWLNVTSMMTMMIWVFRCCTAWWRHGHGGLDSPGTGSDQCHHLMIFKSSSSSLNQHYSHHL